MYPNTFYRVSVKAYITNENGEVFVVRENAKEGDSWWGLPGGGLDHGESPEEGIRREIREELGAVDVEVKGVAYAKSFYLDRKDAWMLWVVYRATIQSDTFEFGDGVTDARFINPAELSSSEDMFERAVFEASTALDS